MVKVDQCFLKHYVQYLPSERVVYEEVSDPCNVQNLPSAWGMHEKVSERDPSKVTIPSYVLAFRFFDRVEIRFSGGEVEKGKRRNFSPWYYLEEKIMSIEELLERCAEFNIDEKAPCIMQAQGFEHVVINHEPGEYFGRYMPIDPDIAIAITSVPVNAELPMPPKIGPVSGFFQSLFARI